MSRFEAALDNPAAGSYEAGCAHRELLDYNNRYRTVSNKQEQVSPRFCWRLPAFCALRQVSHITHSCDKSTPAVGERQPVCYSALLWIISGLPGATLISPMPAKRRPASSATCNAAVTITRR